ncbi:serine hydrolase [Bradyrhizobium sp. BR 10261]|nr:serine hydrolase [Bradyrhizobium sp. BR 10261]
MRKLRFAVSGAALAMLVLAASISSHSVYAQGEAAIIWPTRQWQTSTPEEQGMDSAALAKLLDFGATRSLDSLLVVRHGRIVLDAYYAPYAADIPHRINSATKAVIGTLVAIARKDGLLDSFDHPMLDFFGDRAIANVDDRKKAITIQNLLDMTSGLDWKEPLDGRPDTMIQMSREQDWTQFVLDRPMSSTPGDIFNYNSGGTHVLSAIIAKLAGMNTADYAKAKLFGPLGISVSNWWRDPEGIPIGGFGLALLPRDMAKIGYLYLRSGEWENKSLLPLDWIDKVNHATVNMNMPRAPDLRYSNLFWALPEKNVFIADGYHCQLIMVLPRLDIVAVTTARDFCPLGRLADLIAGAVKSETALPPDAAGANLLAEKIRELSTEKATEVGATPEIASAISGKAYKFPANALGVKSLSLTLIDPNPHYDLQAYVRDRGRQLLQFSDPIGLDGLYRKGQLTASGIFASKGRWLNDKTFEIERQAVGMDELQKWTLSFDGDRLNLHGKDREGRDVSVDSEPGG